MIKFQNILLTGLTIMTLTGCNSQVNSVNEGKLDNNIQLSQDTETVDLAVTILPQSYLVRKIGGDRVKVNVMVKPGASPHTYEPLPQQLKELNEAEGYITIGDSFEKAWMDKIQSVNSQMLMIDSAQGIDKMEMIEHDHHDHDNDHHEGEHDHENHAETLDPHIWLSPQLVKIQAENIYQGLIKLDPENQAEYQQNLEKFLKEIDQLDQQIRENLTAVKNRKFMVFHPSWGYFARDYNLQQIPIEVGGQEPSASELAELIDVAKQQNIKVIFAQPEFSAKSAETIAKEINGEVLFISPLAENWSDNLLKISETFGETLSQN